MDYEEMPTYSGMKLFSDIGGAACLGMGVSMASIVGIFEYIIYKYGDTIIISSFQAIF